MAIISTQKREYKTNILQHETKTKTQNFSQWNETNENIFHSFSMNAKTKKKEKINETK